jgi:hypothetical protein
VSTFRLDPQARARVQIACDIVNKEIAEQWRNITLASIGIAILAIPAGIAHPDQWRTIAYGALILVAIVVGNARREVAKTYKGLVVHRVVKALGDGLTYRPESSLTEKAFLAMELFADTPTSFTSEDEIGAKKNNVSYSVHEVRATRREQKRTVVIFGGLMIRLDFNKNFRGRTSVVPNGERVSTGSLLGKLLSAVGTAAKAAVRLENPDFERVFDVYSTDDQEARYLLTPKLMELVLAANAAQSGGTLRLAFVENSLYVAIPMKCDYFEASLRETVTPESAVGDLAEVIAFAERLVDEFQLETRLWSRA